MRRRVYDAAIGLFAEKGYRSTSFDDIAAAADVARATVFNYFKTKDQFLVEWGEERRRRLGAQLIQASSRESGVAEQLVRCMERLAGITMEEPAVTAELLGAWVRSGAPIDEEPHSAYLFAQIILEGKASGQVRATVDHLTAGRLIRDMYLGTLYRWVGSQGRGFPLADELTASLRLILDGILDDS